MTNSKRDHYTGNIEIDALQEKSQTKLLLDDISVTQRYCQTGGSCDFEFDNCGWDNLQTSSSGRSNSVLWLRVQPTSRYIKGSLLHYDHTTQSNRGNYLLMPAMMAANARSVLASPLIRQRQSPIACFTMYYFAQGANTSVVALTVRLVDIGKQKSTAAYTLNATTSLYWVKAELEFEKAPTTYAFQIEGSFFHYLKCSMKRSKLFLFRLLHQRPQQRHWHRRYSHHAGKVLRSNAAAHHDDNTGSAQREETRLYVNKNIID